MERVFRSRLAPYLLILDDLVGQQRLIKQRSLDLCKPVSTRHPVSSLVITSDSTSNDGFNSPFRDGSGIGGGAPWSNLVFALADGLEPCEFSHTDRYISALVDGPKLSRFSNYGRLNLGAVASIQDSLF